MHIINMTSKIIKTTRKIGIRFDIHFTDAYSKKN